MRVTRSFSALLLIATMIGVSSADGPAGSSQTNAALEITYRQEFVSTFAPDLMIVVRNRTDRHVTAALEWTPRVCEGRKAELSRRSSLFIAQLFRARPKVRLALPPRGWASLIVPLGATVADGDPSRGKADCRSHFSVRTTEGDPVEWSIPLEPALVEADLRRSL